VDHYRMALTFPYRIASEFVWAVYNRTKPLVSFVYYTTEKMTCMVQCCFVLTLLHTFASLQLLLAVPSHSFFMCLLILCMYNFRYSYPKPDIFEPA